MSLALAQQWRATATWIAPHAKYIAIYDSHFWHGQGFPDDAASAHGPLGEIHDAYMQGGSTALFGFFGVPAHMCKSVTDDELRARCRAPFFRLFSSQAETLQAEFVKD